MSESHELGSSGEDLAADYLKKNGYYILFRNWTWGKNEIDIIASKGNFLVFVEVKSRSEDFIADLRMMIPVSKQRAIINAADGYIKRFRIDKESRFDVITVIGRDDDRKLEHIEDAFYPTLR